MTQQLVQLTGRSHHDVSRPEVFIQGALHPDQQRPGSTILMTHSRDRNKHQHGTPRSKWCSCKKLACASSQLASRVSYSDTTLSRPYSGGVPQRHLSSGISTWRRRAGTTSVHDEQTHATHHHLHHHTHATHTNTTTHTHSQLFEAITRFGFT